MKANHFLWGACILAPSVLAAQTAGSQLVPRFPAPYRLPPVGEVSGSDWLSAFHGLQNAQGKLHKPAKSGRTQPAGGVDDLHNQRKDYNAAKAKYDEVTKASGLTPQQLKATVGKHGFLTTHSMKELDKLHPVAAARGRKRRKVIEFLGMGDQKKKVKNTDPFAG